MTGSAEYMGCRSFWPLLLSLMALVLREALLNGDVGVEGRDRTECWKQIRTLTDKDNNEEAL